ncbi:hypothetical protein HNY73_014969 [Argiope bruennichi]|uniref:Uncharacterized protein n=1 Tax=Argiope bruennichi TaxID=94029 RepID=A0A8T0ES10_ARGBR|nr:hypothetical protein HNY73_014969 [Argiope bruennichi]
MAHNSPSVFHCLLPGQSGLLRDEEFHMSRAAIVLLSSQGKKRMKDAAEKLLQQLLSTIQRCKKCRIAVLKRSVSGFKEILR